MSDEVDMAQDVVELTNTVAVLAIRHQLQAAGREYCQSCGEAMPVALHAVPERTGAPK